MGLECCCIFCFWCNTALEKWESLKKSSNIKSERFIWVNVNGEPKRLSCKKDCAQVYGIPPRTFNAWTKKKMRFKTEYVSVLVEGMSYLIRAQVYGIPPRTFNAWTKKSMFQN